jgi:hypothetical protein
VYYMTRLPSSPLLVEAAMSVATNLPTLDEWMDLRARLTDVFGEQPTKTLLTLLPAPTEGGFATNVRIDLSLPL